MYLLDSNVCIHLLNERHTEIERCFRLHTPAEIALCSIVKAELIFGARNSQYVEANLQRLKSFFGPLASLPFDDRCAEEYGQIRADLKRQGKLIGPNDLLIAATARAHDAILVTHNIEEFNRIIGIRLEDWETSQC